MKKKISIFLGCLLMLVFLVSINTYADSKSSNKWVKCEEDLSEYVDLDELEAYLIKKTSSCKAEIDLTKFNIPLEAENALEEYFLIIPKNFHVYHHYAIKNDEIITKLKVEYVCTAKEYNKAYSKFKKSLAFLMDDLTYNDSLTSVQKALLLHDRLAILCEYDIENYNNNTIPNSSYTMYGPLVNKKSVCEGYALTYKMLLAQVGIDSDLCTSKKLGHTWNIVYIGGEKYHVDVTWDDPKYDVSGKVLHENFLLSTKAFKKTPKPHNASDYDSSPNSTKYDDGSYWIKSETAFQLINRELYYLKQYSKTVNNITVYVGDVIRLNGFKVLYSIEDKWTRASDSGGGYWKGNYSKLASDGTYLYVSERDCVKRINVNTGKVKDVSVPKLKTEEGKWLYGFTYLDGYLICEVFESPDFTLKTKNNQIKYKINDAINLGDVEKNDVINANDALKVLKHSAKIFTLTAKQRRNADVYDDGIINASDALMILKYAAKLVDEF